MTFVHETHQLDCTADLAVRIGAALPFITGVRPADPPYDAPAGAHIGHGVAVVDEHSGLHIRCFVVLDVRTGLTVHAHAQLIAAVVSQLVRQVCQRPCSVSIVVSDVHTQGTHV